MKYCVHCGSLLETKEIDGFKRYVCPQQNCQHIEWNNPTPVVAAIVQWQGDILLARHKTWPEGAFGLISGYLEHGEGPEEAIVREVKEELNLDTIKQSFIGHYCFLQKNQLIIAYHIEAEGRVFRNEEIEELKRVKPKDLIPWDFGTGLAVKDWLKSLPS